MCDHTLSDKITYHSEILKWPGSLDVLQGLLQALQLRLHLILGLLSVLQSLSLECVDRLDLAGDVVSRRLEVLDVGLDLVDYGLVLQDRAVVGEVDILGGFGEELHLTSGVVVALLEGLQGGGRLAAEAERAGDLDPVDFESGAAL